MFTYNAGLFARKRARFALIGTQVLVHSVHMILIYCLEIILITRIRLHDVSFHNAGSARGAASVFSLRQFNASYFH